MSSNEIAKGWNGRTIPLVIAGEVVLISLPLLPLPFLSSEFTLGICCICNSPVRVIELVVKDRRGWDLFERFRSFKRTCVPSRFACFSASSSSDNTAWGFPTAEHNPRSYPMSGNSRSTNYMIKQRSREATYITKKFEVSSK